jgi:hypothetical protein
VPYVQPQAAGYIEAQGVAVVPFAAWKSEDTVSVVGQTNMLATANIKIGVVADSDDIVAQDWLIPFVTNIVAGTGFKINLKPSWGDFLGAVNVNWSWRN